MIDKETLDKAADAAERTHESWGGWEDVAAAVLEAAGYSELQAYARDLEARLGRVEALAKSAAPMQGVGGMYSGILIADHVLAALTATEAQA